MLCEHSRPFWRMWGTAVWSQAFSKRFPTLKTVLSAASGLIHCGDVRPVFICFIPVQWKANTRCLSWGFLDDFQKSESHLCWAMRDKVSIVFKLCGWSAEVLFTGWKKKFWMWGEIWSPEQKLSGTWSEDVMFLRRTVHWGADRNSKAPEGYSFPDLQAQIWLYFQGEPPLKSCTFLQTTETFNLFVSICIILISD